MAMLSRLSLAAVGLLLGLAAVEAVLRVIDPPVEVFNPLHGFHDADPRLGWKGKPNIQRRFHKPGFDVLIEHDAGGFRRPSPEPSNAAIRRALVLGDSFVWGWGVPQGHVFTDWLQAGLSPNAALVNRGVNGFSTGQEYLLLRDELARQRYDRIAVLFFENDLTENIDRKRHRPYFELVGADLAARNLPAPARFESPLAHLTREHCRAWLFLSYQLAALRARIRQGVAGLGERGDAVLPLGDRLSESLRLTARLLAEMARVSRAAGAEFFLVYAPARSEFEGQAQRFGGDPRAAASVEHLVAEICQQEGIRLIDLTAPFREQASRGTRLMFQGDDHWTAEGHRLAAQLILGSELLRDWRKPGELVNTGG